MRKFKILFIISLGVICFILQKGCFKKEEYKLEGRYNLKQVELFDNGLEAHINNSNIEIIKSNNEYTIKGKHFDIKRFSLEKNGRGCLMMILFLLVKLLVNIMEKMKMIFLLFLKRHIFISLKMKSKIL